MADTYDLITLDEAKRALRIAATDVSADTNLTRAITSVSRRLDRYIGPTVQRSVTSERHDGGRIKIELNYGPVSAVGSVVEYQSTLAVTLTEETVGTEPTDAWHGERYWPDPTLYSGVIVRRLGGHDCNFWYGRGNVVCSYTAGRASSTTNVDERIKEGAAIFLRSWWRTYEQSTGGFGEFEVPTMNFPGFAVPNAAKDLLHDLWQVEVGFG